MSASDTTTLYVEQAGKGPLHKIEKMLNERKASDKMPTQTFSRIVAHAQKANINAKNFAAIPKPLRHYLELVQGLLRIVNRTELWVTTRTTTTNGNTQSETSFVDWAGTAKDTILDALDPTFRHMDSTIQQDSWRAALGQSSEADSAGPGVETVIEELDAFAWGEAGPSTRSTPDYTAKAEAILNSWAVFFIPLHPYLATVEGTIKTSLQRLETYPWDVEAPLLPQWEKQVATTRGVFKRSAADPAKVHQALRDSLVQFKRTRGDAQAGATVKSWIGNILERTAGPMELVLALAEIDEECHQVHKKPSRSSGGPSNKAGSSSRSRVNANAPYPQVTAAAPADASLSTPSGETPPGESGTGTAPTGPALDGPEPSAEEGGPGQVALTTGISISAKAEKRLCTILFDSASSYTLTNHTFAARAGWRRTGRTRKIGVFTAFGEKTSVEAKQVEARFRITDPDNQASQTFRTYAWAVPNSVAHLVLSKETMRRLDIRDAGDAVDVPTTRAGRALFRYADLKHVQDDIVAAATGAEPAAGPTPGADEDAEPITREELNLGPDVTDAQAERLLAFANDHKGLFRVSYPLRATPLAKADLVVQEGATPYYRPSYGASLSESEKLIAAVWEQVRLGIAVPVARPGLWCSPVFPTYKKDGSVRVILDARGVNDRTQKPPTMTGRAAIAAAQGVGRYKYRCVIDVKHAFLHVELTERAAELLTFQTPDGQTFQMRRMPMGLSQAPALWTQVLQTALGSDLLQRVEFHMDDLTFGANDLDELWDLTFRVFQALDDANLTISLHKCQLGHSSVTFIGLQLDEDGIHLPPDRAQALAQAERPRSKKELASFLGMVEFYAAALEDVAAAKAGLLELVHQDARFAWTDLDQEMFDHIKHALIQNAFVTFPEWDKGGFTLGTDASDVAIGAVLGQIGSDGIERPIEFRSHKLSGSETRWSIYQAELHAVYWALDKFHYAVDGRHVDIYVDNEAVVKLLNGNPDLDTIKNPHQRRWVHRILQYDITVHHRPGVENCGPDYVSRRPGGPEHAPQGTLGSRIAGNHHEEWRERTKQLRTKRMTKAKAKPTGPKPASNPLQRLLNSDQFFRSVAEGDSFLVAAGLDEGARLRQEAGLSDADQALPAEIDSALNAVESNPTANRRSSRVRARRVDQQRQLLAQAKAEPVGDDKQTADAEPSATDSPRQTADKTAEHGQPTTSPRWDSAREVQHMVNAHGAAHLGLQATITLAEEYGKRNGVTWTDLKKTAELVVQGCHACNKHKPKRGRPASGGAGSLSDTVTRPNQRWWTDLAGPFAASDGSYHLLVVRDAWSKLTLVRPLPSTSAPDTRVAFQGLFAQLGAPSELLSDRGTNFYALAQRMWLEEVGIRGIYSAAGNAQGNGGAERAVRSVKEVLRTVCADLDPAVNTKGEYVERLHRGLQAINGLPSAATGEAPFDVHFGRTTLAVEHAGRNGGAEEQGPKRAEPRFKVGDEVWRKYGKAKGAGAHKTYAHGPYVVRDVVGGSNPINTFRISKPDGSTVQTVNGRHLFRGRTLELDARLADSENQDPGRQTAEGTEIFVENIVQAQGPTDDRRYLVETTDGEAIWLPASDVSPRAISEFEGGPGHMDADS